jgi:hypothetical protein
MLAYLSLLPEATSVAVERAAAALASARAVLAAKRGIADRARQSCAEADRRADRLQSGMDAMWLLPVRRPSMPPMPCTDGVVWRRPEP